MQVPNIAFFRPNSIPPRRTVPRPPARASTARLPETSNYLHSLGASTRRPATTHPSEATLPHSVTPARATAAPNPQNVEPSQTATTSSQATSSGNPKPRGVVRKREYQPVTFFNQKEHKVRIEVRPDA